MSSTTARPLRPAEPFLITRSVPSAVLKYPDAGTSFSKPEDIVEVISKTPLRGVAIREETSSTGGRLPLVFQP